MSRNGGLILGVHEPTQIRSLIVRKIAAVVENIHNYKTGTVLTAGAKEWRVTEKELTHRYLSYLNEWVCTL